MTELIIKETVKNGISGYLFDGEFFSDYEDAKKRRDKKKREKEEIEKMSSEEIQKQLKAISDESLQNKTYPKNELNR